MNHVTAHKIGPTPFIVTIVQKQLTFDKVVKSCLTIRAANQWPLCRGEEVQSSANIIKRLLL